MPVNPSPPLLNSIRNRMTSEFADVFTIYDANDVVGKYGSDNKNYTLRLDGDGNPIKYAGSLQQQQRNPNMPEVGDNTITTNNYVCKLQWDANIPTTSRLQCNNGGMYQVERTNVDKSDRYTLDVFCVSIK